MAVKLYRLYLSSLDLCGERISRANIIKGHNSLTETRVDEAECEIFSQTRALMKCCSLIRSAERGKVTAFSVTA